MPDLSGLTTFLVVLVAFAIGYGVVNFIIYVLRRGRGQHVPGFTRGKNSGYSDKNNETSDIKAEGEAYYSSVLGLPAIYSTDDISSNYHRLAAKYHPDKVNHLGPRLKMAAEEEMKEIIEAYAYFKQKYSL